MSKNPKILIVDEDPGMLELYCCALEQVRITNVVACGTGQQAIEALHNGVDRSHKNAMLNQPANELGAAFRTPVWARFARVSFVLKTL